MLCLRTLLPGGPIKIELLLAIQPISSIKNSLLGPPSSMADSPKKWIVMRFVSTNPQRRAPTASSRMWLRRTVIRCELGERTRVVCCLSNSSRVKFWSLTKKNKKKPMLVILWFSKFLQLVKFQPQMKTTHAQCDFTMWFHKNKIDLSDSLHTLATAQIMV